MFKQIKMLTKISNFTIIGYSILSIILGISGFAFIVLVNAIIELLINNKDFDRSTYLILFIGVIILFLVSRRLLSGGIIHLSQDIFWNIRKAVIEGILQSPIKKIKENKDQIYSSLTIDVGNITTGSLMLIDFISAIIIVISCLVYMAYISISLFLVSFAVICIAAGVYIFRSKGNHMKFKISRDLEKNFIGLFNSILNGSKEIKMNPIIGKKINTKIGGVMNTAKSNDKGAFIGYLNNQVTGQVLFYLLISFIILYSSTLFDVSVESSISYIFVLLYLLGPLGMVMMVFPVMNRTIISLDKLVKLMNELKDQNGGNLDHQELDTDMNFDRLEYKDYAFSYGENLFSVGPINLTIDKGEVVFIYGSNGSGKTTLFNTLLNIYEPNNGTVTLNEETISIEHLLSFKGLFSPVFSDFYLFDEMYGVNEIDINQANEYLKIFEIDEKVIIENNKFSTIDLSTGQRKRLALINAILEKKPILVLDEWAADQDPIFRQKFYEEIVPYLVGKGFTIIAITHDDKYYSCADKLFKMEYGQLFEIELVNS